MSLIPAPCCPRSLHPDGILLLFLTKPLPALLSPCHRDGPGPQALLGFVSRLQALSAPPGSLIFQKIRSFPGVGLLFSNNCGINAPHRTSLGTLPSPSRSRLSLCASLGMNWELIFVIVLVLGTRSSCVLQWGLAWIVWNNSSRNQFCCQLLPGIMESWNRGIV